MGLQTSTSNGGALAVGTNVNATASGAMVLGGGSLTNSQQNSLMVGFQSGTPTLYVEHAQVGINCSAPNNSYALQVVGNVGVVGQISASSATINGTVNSCSDARYKKDVEVIDNSLTRLLQLRGVYYNWRQEDFPEKVFSDNRQLGFIAQELEPLFPELVHTDEEGFKSVDYSSLTPILVEALKSQQTEIERLNAKMERFEKAFSEIGVQID